MEEQVGTNPNKTLVHQSNLPPLEQSPMQGCLVIIYGEDLGRRIPISTQPMIVGRSSKSEIQLDQEAVSRNHCRIRYNGKHFMIRDLGSTNGTYVDDKLIDETRLRDGDQIKIGRTILKFILGSNVETQYHEEIYRIMTTDGLTQVHNKRYFDEMLGREVSRARRYERHFCLLIFDVDHFKKINDAYGHLAGDAALRQIGAIAKGRVRTNDVIARIGGEEFGLITPEIHLEGAADLARKLNRIVRDERFEFENERIEITISVGAAQWQSHYENPSEIIKAADEKLYEAKRLGRDRVCF